jgi:hypothetical protein
MPTAKFETSKFCHWFRGPDSRNRVPASQIETRKGKWSTHLIVNLRKVKMISFQGAWHPRPANSSIPAYAQTPVDGRPTLRWSGMDSNFQFRARSATVSRLRPSPSGVDPPTARRSHPTSCRPRVKPIELSGGVPRSATHRPNQVASPRAALSARRAHRFGWIDVLNLPSSSGERPCPSNAIRPQPNAWFRSAIRSSTGWESLPRRLRSWAAQNPMFLPMDCNKAGR